MISEVFIQNYTDFPFDEKEILRYAGCKEIDQDSEVVQLMRDCINEVSRQKACTFNLSYRILPIKSMKEGNIDFEAVKIQSHDLERCLKDCNRVVFMAATIGHGYDRLIQKYKRIDSARTLFLQAIGAERIETMLDTFCKELPGKIEAITGEKDISIRPRFSPGFGDLTLKIQPQVLEIFNAYKRLGISLNDSLLMSPSKSVTAIIGIYK